MIDKATEGINNKAAEDSTTKANEDIIDKATEGINNNAAGQ